MKRKVLFIDRDGTIIREPEDFQIDSFEKLVFLPKAISSLSKIARELDYTLVLVSNQDGLGTNSFPEETFWPVQNFILNTLADEGVVFTDIYVDDSFEYENKPTRKPGLGMLGKYVYGEYDLANSYVLGDRQTDIQLAENLGSQAIYINEEKDDRAALSTMDWEEIYQFLKQQPRIGREFRTTNETTIDIEVNLDSAKECSINTGLAFFDHMLEQVNRHGNIGLKIEVNGDLQVDEHHTIEDTAIALGTAFKKALGSKKSIERYGFLLPMDECLAQVAIDFGGRAWIVWDAEFKREKVGDMPTEMFFHFFKSFSDAASCNLNIKVEGDNEHHKIESIFKAFAKAIKMAVSKTENYNIPSTKGIL
ncbi:bifunctional histidinol-phosphatase/imidazoleglycerol-phosphate dehydratase HisB [Myroides marinus]|uniref:Histidine biosynthesis bifunctional protein HisB n=1 Tax=Myroides marinus TaxID=703342 RepID=A0A1H6WZ40_9FLAO|nr:bifunctional histidinol-phosphatase/imidazoleglycerol-phosphate dehydratase HisB [Myroides marinus]MDM1378033.1 bifunctional histidinol-phosphatase/imidazoleglycerol-phosphate dehydratase HisB [Myroides marinus]MDM1385304.1 bifunctional histidinol-phosphatase/imidazoleglycerol-phosphate dehydratase HisB [Myroides marinus]MDM1392517.1 bifunctional histidinol-phosphatase/imidazoleglycerol-phosphate dehydratase HisB [Myroides marinus]MDM1503740.1 bifunctional histidinol-phosphatase/imidazolegly